MRVLTLHSRYLSWVATGENRVVDDETRLLREAGHEVHVWDPPFSMGGMGLVRRGVDAIWSTQAVKRVRSLVRQLEPEVIHCHNLFPTLSPAALRVGETEGAAVVMTLHNYRLMCLPGTFFRDGEVCELCLGTDPWPGVKYKCLKGSRAGSAALASSISLHRRLGSFDAVRLYLAVSRFVRYKYVQAGFRPDQVKVKPHFAWPVQRREGPGSYFLYVGRLSREKGVDTLLEAWKDLKVPLVVVGDGPDAVALRARAPAGVEFRGPLPPSEIPAIYAGARAVLVPSQWYEPAGKTITEAFAAGAPVLASRIAGPKELVEDGVTGALVEPGDAGAWRDAVEAMMDDSLSEALGCGAYGAWERHYSPEVGLRALEAAYEEAIAVAIK